MKSETMVSETMVSETTMNETTVNGRLVVLGTALVLSLSVVACRSTTPEMIAPETALLSSAAAGETWSNTIKWATASEVDNFGYDIYRAEAADGPFERLTEEPIEGAGTTDEVSRYEFEDHTIDPLKTYYYYIESISMEGVRERFTPVGEKKPKIQPGGEPST
jgi:hypothetical protein